MNFTKRNQESETNLHYSTEKSIGRVDEHLSVKVA